MKNNMKVVFQMSSCARENNFFRALTTFTSKPWTMLDAQKKAPNLDPAPKPDALTPIKTQLARQAAS
jgi:hypothetical protein